ncbi:MFS general substrate transporter [Lojkania enalia]|uniref:MFS general substrate transporter n=1 Tax=Lojkania enalia TaxID=147567 RepID=A0A9P4NA17_9PLEO|nr:MFS general substrate transporter [Didymosphaeria enalia]
MPRDPKDEPFPTRQLIIVGICRFSEPIAFNSILAYSYVMVKDLGIDEKDASFYSGLLVSAYAVAEAITALGWGAISDVYGRKPVALIGLGGVALSSLIFGLAKNYWIALLARFVGGALNGNVAIMQTMVQEMVKNPAHEPKAYATQPFVWTLGGIIGSAMGGFLAQPAHFYPSTFSQDGIFGTFPYLLPNLVAAGSIVIAIIQGILFLKETNPAFQEEEDTAVDDESIDERAPLLTARDRTRRSMSRTSRPSITVIESLRKQGKRPSFLEEGLPMPMDQRFDIRRESFGTMHAIHIPKDQQSNRRLSVHPTRPPLSRNATSAYQGKVFNFTIVMIVVALVIVAYHQMAFVTAMPVFMLDDPYASGLDFKGGLGLTLHDVGTFLAVNGFITLFVQAVIFPPFVEKIGVWRSFVSMIVLYPTCYFIVPFVSALPDNLVSAGIYLSFILQAFYGIISFPCALILMKNATPSPLVLGRVNGLAMSACCLARTVGPPLVGIIYSFGGSAAAFFSCAGVAFLGVVQLFWVPREHVGHIEVESGLKDVLRGEIHADGVHDEAVED